MKLLLNNETIKEATFLRLTQSVTKILTPSSEVLLYKQIFLNLPTECPLLRSSKVRHRHSQTPFFFI
jgi:hypothetical protein